MVLCCVSGAGWSDVLCRVVCLVQAGVTCCVVLCVWCRLE